MDDVIQKSLQNTTAAAANCKRNNTARFEIRRQ